MLKGMARLAPAAMLFRRRRWRLLYANRSCAHRRSLMIALAEHCLGAKNCYASGINVNLRLAPRALPRCLGKDQSQDKPIVTIPLLSGALSLCVPAVRASLQRGCQVRLDRLRHRTSDFFCLPAVVGAI